MLSNKKLEPGSVGKLNVAVEGILVKRDDGDMILRYALS